VTLTTSKGEVISVDVVVQAAPTSTMNEVDNKANSQNLLWMNSRMFFPHKMSGMPPNRDIKFIIELLPSIAPIAKIPYRMGVNELEVLDLLWARPI